MKAHEQEALLLTLQTRFAQHPYRHADVDWDAVQSRLAGNDQALQALHNMESTGGEPDVIGRDSDSGKLVFCDCSAQSPEGRRSLCYDREALDSRKANKPEGCVVQMAKGMGIALLTELQYRELQTLGEFDTTTSSWVHTPDAVRELGGALFCDRRYGQVFVYHNGAQSYYAARGFRGRLVV